jgi:hypothetical protein
LGMDIEGPNLATGHMSHQTKQDWIIEGDQNSWTKEDKRSTQVGGASSWIQVWCICLCITFACLHCTCCKFLLVCVQMIARAKTWLMIDLVVSIA